jgi:[acyl-carrier-protein] S-malonyltransferase
MKIAYLFPGQGAQAVGMGRELAQNLPGVMAVFDRANEVLGRDLKKIMFEGPEEALKETRNTQPCLYTCSLAILEVVRSFNLQPAFVAGHSLGEYSALAAAGAFSFEDGLKLVQKRAEAMTAAAANIKGGMAAVLGLEDSKIREICAAVNAACSGQESVEPANFNCPGQVVLSGSNAALEKALQLAQDGGASKVIPLAVSGPFHSRFMAPVGEVLRGHITAMPSAPAKPAVIANYNAQPVETVADWAEGLIRQVSGSVLWTASLEHLASQGVDTFLEIGPGRVLSGLVKKTLKAARIANVEDLKSLEKARQVLEIQ